MFLAGEIGGTKALLMPGAVRQGRRHRCWSGAIASRISADFPRCSGAFSRIAARGE